MSDEVILIVEDDKPLQKALSETLELAGYKVYCAGDGDQALTVLERHADISLVITDIQMHPMDGYTLLNNIRRKYRNLPVIIMTAYGTIDNAVKALHEGAVDYLVKPLEAEHLLKMVEKHVIPVGSDKDGIMVVADPVSRELARLAKRVAGCDATVMITGESGTGKEVLARYIHAHSPRSRQPFVAINCAAIPENMLEAVLFGYERGAFTGAHQSSPGKFEQAQGGTLLLDEITEMDAGLQSKLLRVLQEKEVERLGGRHMIKLDVRVLATSNRDLAQAVRDGCFREDLYYRLNVFPLELPPLRKRREDILPLARRFISQYLNGESYPELGRGAMGKLQDYDWPGNVRELENVIQRALILKRGTRIAAEDIHFEQMTASALHENEHLQSDAVTRERLGSALRQQEADIIITALEEGGSRTEVARKLGISPRTLRYKLAKLRDAGVCVPA
ncbi:sigma-54-dependent transcriptional regulator [Thiolapillus brandeum]|uniref:Two component system response regulator FlrC n=1 Tax=Thiolapillus brandeum TaxID=1076588 RepID=A0A7U6JHB7_9GAMM|nr:sigma-54 dependent transcriptional regulator [Thiolapillus brandeum]BAO44304.1 two component system response regulator FlrC [Thiolapillus brandeum]